MDPVQLAVGAPDFLPRLLSGPTGTISALLLLALSLLLIFAGKSFVKVLVFLASGLAGAAFGLAAGTFFLGFVGALIGGALGFVVGGLIGLFVLHLGIGLAAGYLAYLISRAYVHSLLLAVAVGVVFFVVGLVAAMKLLELATAVLGALMAYGVLVYFGLPPLGAGLASVALAVAGFFVQQRRRGTADDNNKPAS